MTRTFAGYGAAALVALICAVLASYLPAVTSGQIPTFGIDWAPALGIRLSFMLDGLSLLFALLISGIGSLIFLYATGYMGNHPRFRGFIATLFAFMIAMLGLVMARDLITLFLFWELTSVTSYLLIGFNHDSPQARRNALQAMLITAGGGLALLAGFILIETAAGSYDLAQILSGPGLQNNPHYTAILILVLLGAFTKSAQFPFHFWLPNAMAAPTPVSAYLHSATMVKAGVYLLARLHPTLADTTAWSITLGTLGATTAVLASVLALRQSDMKQALAYTTLMALGTITLFLAGSGPYALTAALTFLVAHALYKATLFMVVGAIDHSTGTRQIAALGGLRRAMPLTALAAVLAAASMAGLPPLVGWIAKELLYAGALTLHPASLATAAALAANALMVAVAATLAIRPFFGADKPTPIPAHEAPWTMLLGPLLLAALGLVTGLAAPQTLGPLIEASLTTSLAQPRAAGLHLWAGWNLPLFLSGVTFAAGALIFALRAPIVRWLDTIFTALPRFDTGWDRALDAFKAGTAWQTRALQTGRLTDYLLVTFIVIAGAITGTVLAVQPQISAAVAGTPFLWLIAALTGAGGVAALTTRSRIAAIAGLGTVGIGVAVIFLYFGAPDVATTQLMVETLAAVLFAIGALRLPAVAETRTRRRQILHAALAATIGVGVTLTILAIGAHPLDRHITTYFEENAYTLAHGLNIVNVILVDFRAFDTFGELIVVLLAAFGARAVLKRKRGRNT
ncbi:hydrogen gas-evolving membrane-bound hydrogenase subunit E [Ketogulonicigenium robustum]|nr:hydrogen gas-evolving membrane-bound hydrogenase subunit E [Ketogulonicigenium robustum]